jgi:hydrogenase 3 maturation protease
MLSKSWQERAIQISSRLKNGRHPPRIAVIGIGNELRGDDAAGLALARELRALIPAQVGDRYLVVEAGSAPENMCGLLRRFKPDLVLLVDAANLGTEPGTLQWLEWPMAVGFSVSTHSLPIHMVAAYLEAELGCVVELLGIQPASIAFNAPLSPPVSRAVKAAAKELVAIIEGYGCNGKDSGRG